jgi:Glycosyl hydrolases family 35
MAELAAMHLPAAAAPASRASRWIEASRRIWLGVLIGAIAVLSHASILPSLPRQQATISGRGAAQPPRGVEIAEHGGYPELRVDGSPYFIHSAAFFYYRIPRDQWEQMLNRYISVGINTIDIYIPWNWHEPKEGEFDFDGHTNPRRDLRGLLALTAQVGLKLIARPGPEVLNEWRHGGYPAWLLERPEYKMDPRDFVEGRYAPLDDLNPRDAEAAARGWLDNSTHMTQAREWLGAVAKQLAPYSSHRTLRAPADGPEGSAHDTSGPLLFVQLGDDFASGRSNQAGPDFWRYAGKLCEMLEAGGLDVPVFINPTDMRVSAAGSDSDPPIGVAGQWYLWPDGAPSGPSERSLTARDAGEIEFLTEELKTQPAFPPVMIEYQAGWYAPADDDRPLKSFPQNTLLGSRLLIGNGIHGLNYFPLQDTFTPAGYSVPWANRSYRWDAALGPDGDAQPRLAAVLRNSRLLARWGSQLAASHKRADFGIVDPLGACPQELLTTPDTEHIRESVMRIERLGRLAMFSSELLDPEYQSTDQLLRDPLLLLPVFDPEEPQFQLSERAQRKLVEYVRRGGTLVVFPEEPAGDVIDELWESAPDSGERASDAVVRGRWNFGDGEVIESSIDFFSWLALDRSLTENRAQFESGGATSVLSEFVLAARVRPTVRRSTQSQESDSLIVSEMVTNEGTGLLGERQGGRGFLSVTNLAGGDPVRAEFEILSPTASARGSADDYVPVRVVVPPGQSLLLPVEEPICFGNAASAPCADAVTAAGAEFLDARRQERTLELLFYVPARAEVRVRLAEQPSHVTLEETAVLESNWDAVSKELQVNIPRGAAPDFLRTLKIDLQHTPQVPERETPGKPQKPSPKNLEYFVENAVRLPTSENAFLRTYPPLVVPGPGQSIRVVVRGENHDPAGDRDVEVSLPAPLQHSRGFLIPRGGTSMLAIQLRSSEQEAIAGRASGDGLFHSTIELRSGQDRRSLPIAFLPSRPGHTSHYRYDFDRDGADEWVLENDKLRLVVSPESGGRAIALVDKSTGANLSTSVGLLGDKFSYTENAPDATEARARGRYGLSNRPYGAEWLSVEENPALKLAYKAPDVYPAGASIEKTVQFESADTLRVDYRVSLDPLVNNAGAPDQLQSFVAVNSFPTADSPDSPPSLCWSGEAIARGPAVDSGSAAGEGDLHCEDYTPGGAIVRLPAGTAHVEARSAGRPTMAIEWDCASTCPQMTFEPKNFSALFRLVYPPLAPGAVRSEYTMRIRALGSP